MRKMIDHRPNTFYGNKPDQESSEEIAQMQKIKTVRIETSLFLLSAAFLTQISASTQDPGAALG